MRYLDQRHSAYVLASVKHDVTAEYPRPQLVNQLFTLFMIALSFSEFMTPQVYAEPTLKERGLDFGITLTGEAGVRLDSPAAGRPRTERRAVLSVPLVLESEKLFGVQLGTLSIQGLVISEDPDLTRGAPLVDDLHAYSNLRAEDRAQLFEIFWERQWGSWLTRLGKLDANDHFAVSEYEAQLINGAAGFSPSILGLPSYPDSAWSAQVGYQASRLDLLIGVFDGGATELTPIPTGDRFGLSDAALRGGLFWAAQATIHLGGERGVDQAELSRVQGDHEVSGAGVALGEESLKARAPLHLTLGAWTHRGEVNPLEDTNFSESAMTMGREVKGEPSEGLYLTGDLRITRFSSGRELGLGWQAAASASRYPLHLSLALTLNQLWGPLIGSGDGARLAVGLSHISTQQDTDYGLGDEGEQLIEVTLASPITSEALFGVSSVHLWGVGGEPDAHLIVARLTVGTL